MESAKDQCRKVGCPGCRHCLDIRKPKDKKVILKNELSALHNRKETLMKELQATDLLIDKKHEELNEG